MLFMLTETLVIEGILTSLPNDGRVFPEVGGRLLGSEYSDSRILVQPWKLVNCNALLTPSIRAYFPLFCHCETSGYDVDGP